jgi:hypothetical protein
VDRIDSGDQHSKNTGSSRDVKMFNVGRQGRTPGKKNNSAQKHQKKSFEHELDSRMRKEANVVTSDL